MYKKFGKNLFDFFFALVLVPIFLPLIIILTLLTTFDTEGFGIFTQKRIGKKGKHFTIFKLRSMHSKTGNISKFGNFLRKTKIDETPQIFNILIGDMSFVGPRPDIAGYYDLLKGEERKLLLLKPGLTSEAGLKYKNEDVILNQQKNPIKYNDEILFPDKVIMNLEYQKEMSLQKDLEIILKTIRTVLN